MNALRCRRLTRAWPWLGVLLIAGAATAALAQDASDPPARVAYVSQRQGSVVFAPQGEEDWTDLPQNRPLVEGDRLWTDPNARAELQMGTATLHVGSETHLGISSLDERAAQFMIQQGTLNVHVREVTQGENVEVDTPNVAFRAQQAGDFRIDVDPRSHQTRIAVQNGMATIYGEGGQAINLGAGQLASFRGRSLAQVEAPALVLDDFALWAADRNRQEDQDVASRYVPRGVVGAPELDQYGTWGQDPTYGAVWYPAVTVANWAPYRYGHWTWIAPWGWTWIDDAPWGFAPFHYGRWAMIGTHWAWVPGRMAPRPVYAPALVVFLGGGGEFSIGSGPAVGWYPLAPGEAWWPWYHASQRYVITANPHINLVAWPRNGTNHQFRQRGFAVTAVREEDFRRGRPVERSWQPVQPQMIDRAQVNVVPVRPPRGAPREGVGAPQQRTSMPAIAPRPTPDGNGWTQPRELPPRVREQTEAQRAQERLQHEADWQARQQIRAGEQAQSRQPGAVRNRPVPGWQPQREAEASQGREGWERPHPVDAPRMLRQSHPAPVTVPRQQSVPIVREEHRPAHPSHVQAQPAHREEGQHEGRWQR